jgi:glycosyltransferase involved in cell wall biosynthesis
MNGRRRWFMQKTFIRISTQVLIAALNEEQGIKPTISELSRTLKTRFLVVDGKSEDNTARIAESLGAQVIVQDGNGKGDAIMKGLKHLHSETKYVVFTDADYTYPADSVPTMIKILENNPDVGMVCGNRFGNQTEAHAFLNSFKLGNRLLAIMHKLLNGIFLSDPLTGLRVIRANVLKRWKVKSKGFDVEVELNRELNRQCYAMVEVPIRYRARVGKKKLRVKDGISILKRILLESAYALVERF